MLRRLPDDNVRAVLWRFAGREDLRRIVGAARAVARGPVARLVARGARHSDAWTPDKASLVKAFDAAGLSVLAADGEYGGPIDGPKNLGIALAAFELAWVDPGAATTMLGNVLALAPIHERGTSDQRARYMRLVAPGRPGEECEPKKAMIAYGPFYQFPAALAAFEALQALRWQPHLPTYRDGGWWVE